MIFTFTDFGSGGPYLGQVEAILRTDARCDVIHLVSNAEGFDPEGCGYLLAALVAHLPQACVVLGIVDPGVGGNRLPVVLEADGRWFVGPDNGLFNTVAAHAKSARWVVVDWRPSSFAPTFHGRDLFAPIAARIANCDFSWERSAYTPPTHGANWPSDADRIVYADCYGNLMTGRRYRDELYDSKLYAGKYVLSQNEIFEAVMPGEAFWYCNSLGLVEIAVNRGRAAQQLALSIGTPIHFGR